MKITEVRIPGQNLPMTLVEVRSDTGLIGIGGCEAPAAVIRPILKGSPWRLADLLIGQSIDDIDGLWRGMMEATELQGGLVVRAAAALDMAVWDLVGKAQRVPLYKL